MSILVLSNQDFNGTSKIVNLLDPTDAQDAATKNYVDGLVEGLNWKESVLVSTQGNINTASPGATIDGITMSQGDRVLVRLQTAPLQNGIYIYDSAVTAMVRSPDASTFEELEQAVITVEEGTSAGITFRQTEINGTINSDDVVWANFGTVSPTATESTLGLIELANQGEVDAGTAGALAVTPATLAAWAGSPKRFSQVIGDGASTQYTVTHNFATFDVHVTVYQNTGNRADVLVCVTRPTNNSVQVEFTNASSIYEIKRKEN